MCPFSLIDLRHTANINLHRHNTNGVRQCASEASIVIVLSEGKTSAARLVSQLHPPPPPPVPIKVAVGRKRPLCYGYSSFPKHGPVAHRRSAGCMFASGFAYTVRVWCACVCVVGGGGGMGRRVCVSAAVPLRPKRGINSFTGAAE